MLEHYDTLICGAGPAGLAAAEAAAAGGARVGLIDAQASPGGQIWRHDVLHGTPGAAQGVIARALNAGKVRFLPEAQIIDAGEGELLVAMGEAALRLRYGALVIATGARELLLPFPGWTLPGVTGAGGLQALVKQAWPIAGKRVVVAGSGPLPLAAAATLRAHGARVLSIHEQAGWGSVRAFARSLLGRPRLALQALTLRAALPGVPYRCGEFVQAALGEERLRAVEIREPTGRSYRMECDHLAIGYGLVPNVELAQLIGCRLDTSGRHARVATDEYMRTSVPTVYAAGEVCGIGGCAAARIEGALAGHAAVGALRSAEALQPRRRRARRLGASLEKHFALDRRIRKLATSDTLICRCEDVPMRALDGLLDARAAKLATRCGMGACQGRICGAALTELEGYAAQGVRPPLFPVPLSMLADSFIENTA
jgi:D-hydroxyproline dehydrogenase subunit alpha